MSDNLQIRNFADQAEKTGVRIHVSPKLAQT